MDPLNRNEWLEQFEKFKRIHAETTIRHSNNRYAADATLEDKLTDEDKAFLESLKVRV